MRISDWSSDVCSSDLPISLKPSSRPYELSCSAVCGLEHGRGDRLGQARAVESAAQVLTRVLSARVLAPGRAQLRTPGEYPELRCPFAVPVRSEEHKSELQSLMRISYAVFCLKKNTH